MADNRKRVAINPEGRMKPRGVWSQAVVTEPGKLIFISGITARDIEGNVVGVGDITAQTRQVMELMKLTVEAAGGTMADIAQVTVFVRDVGHFDEIHAVRREYFPNDPPASTLVQIVSTVDSRSLIEMNAIAVV